MKRIRADSIAVFLIVLVVAIFFWPVVQGKLPVPTDALVGLYHPWRDLYAKGYPRGVPYKNFLITDPVRQQIPWRKIAIDSWKEGKIPSWNPFNFSGMSLAGNIQAGVFYPFNILFFILNFPRAWTLLIMLQPLLAGIFLYFYLRSNHLSPLASVFGGVTWAFSGFMIAWLTWGTILHVVLWLPLILMSIDKLNNSRLLWSAILVFSLVCQFFAGHAQVSLYVFLLSGFYAFWRRSNFFWILLLLSILLTSIQWIPFVRSLLESSRIGVSDSWQISGWFLPWQHLAQFFAPDFFGNPATLNYWGEWNYGEFIGYISVVGIIFAIFALLIPKKSESVKFLSITLGITLLFLLPTPLAKLPYILKIPVFSSLQPTRLMAIVDFALVMLAAFGFEQWQSKRDKRIWYAVTVVGVILSILWVVTPLLGSTNADIARRNLILPSGVFGLTVLSMAVVSRSWAAVILLLIVSVDLIRFGWKFTPFTPEAYFFPQTAIIEFLQKQPKPFRVMSTDPKIVPPNTLAFYGIESVEGYDPIYSSRYEEFMAALNRQRPDISAPFGFNRIITTATDSSRLLSLMNTQFVLSPSDIKSAGFEKVFQEGQTRIYKNASLVRAYFVEGVRVVHTKQETIEALFTMDSPDKLAIVEKQILLDTIPMNQDERVDLVRYDPDGMEIVTISSHVRFLVIGNMYDPGWFVTIDGNPPVPIYRANYLFFGVVVPSGEHHIWVQYR